MILKNKILTLSIFIALAFVFSIQGAFAPLTQTITADLSAVALAKADPGQYSVDYKI